MTAPSASGLRVVFMGTPDFSVPALRALISSRHTVIAVYSQPPRPKGRGQQVQKSPVHDVAEAAGIPVFTPLSFKKDPAAVEQFRNLQADIAIVAAYGLILPLSVLDAPKFGCLNIHASILPRWRGASPIQHAVWHGDAKSGVTIMQMNEGLDTGDMIAIEEIALTAQTTTQSLHDSLSAMGGGMVVTLLDQLADGKQIPHAKQDDALSVYAPLLKKADGLIDWKNSAAAIDRQVRALNPWPGTYTLREDGFRLKIISGLVSDLKYPANPGTIVAGGGIVCGDGSVYLPIQVQPDNSRAMDRASAINGGYLKVGMSCQSGS